MKKLSQNDLVERRLQETPDQWVEMPELCKVSGSYNIHTRISELRKRGHQISNKQETVNGQRYSYYKLENHDD